MKTVWTSIVGALASAIVAWFLGILPAIWQVVVSAAVWIWNVLFYSVPLPVIVLLPIALLAIIGIFSVWPRGARTLNAGTTTESRETPLDELEQRMLQVLANADGNYVYFDDAAKALFVPRLLLERTLDNLVDRQLIRAEHTVGGSRIFLTPDGRDYVIENNYPLGGRG